MSEQWRRDYVKLERMYEAKCKRLAELEANRFKNMKSITQTDSIHNRVSEQDSNQHLSNAELREKCMYNFDRLFYLRNIIADMRNYDAEGSAGNDTLNMFADEIENVFK